MESSEKFFILQKKNLIKELIKKVGLELTKELEFRFDSKKYTFEDIINAKVDVDESDYINEFYRICDMLVMSGHVLEPYFVFSPTMEYKCYYEKPKTKWNVLTAEQVKAIANRRLIKLIK